MLRHSPLMLEAIHAAAIRKRCGERELLHTERSELTEKAAVGRMPGHGGATSTVLLAHLLAYVTESFM